MPANYILTDAPAASHRVTASELRQIVEWIENMNGRAAEIAEERKAFMAEVKARGYDTRIVAMIVKLRARDPEAVAEEEAVLDMYREVLGMT